jgi:hypothetical protein
MHHLRRLPLVATFVAMLCFAAPSYGSLTAPVGTTTSIGEPVPAFSWTSVAGADHYVFELDSGNTIGTALLTITTKNTDATLTQTIADGPYTWRVRAVDANSNNGPWSTPINWSKAGSGPTLVSPAANATVTYPTPVVLQWTPVDGAFQYVVALSSSSDMSNPVTQTTEGTSYAPGSWLSPGLHYWTVTAKDSRGNPVGTTPSNGIGSAFTWAWPSTVTGLAVNNAIDPSAGAYAQWAMYDPVFSWNPVSGAVRYQVEVNTDDVTWAGASKVCCSDTPATTLTPKGLLPNATYAWRVRSVDASGSVGSWTVGPTFTQAYDSFINAPANTPSVANLRMADNLSDPGTDTDGVTAGYQTQVPVVKWDPVPGASGYDVTMVQYTGGACQWTTGGIPRWSVRTAATSFTPLASGWNNIQPWPANGTSVSTDNYDMTTNMSYCIRVTPFRDTASTGGGQVDVSGDPTYLDPNDDGTAPAFQWTGYPTGAACTAPCTNGYLGAADYEGPLTGSTPAAVPLFTWKPVTGANGYFVIVARDAAFNNIVDYAFTHIPAYAPRNGTSPRTYQNQTTHYYWVVLPATGLDGSGAAVNPNAGHPQSFDRPQIGPTLLTPAAGATVAGLPTFSWDPVDGARQYEVLVSTDPNFGAANTVEDVTTSNTSYTPMGDHAYAADDLYWEVRALDYNGRAQPWSTPQLYHQTWSAPDFTSIVNPTASDVIPVFKWNPVNGAASYTISIDQPGNGNTTQTVQSTAWTPISIWGLGDFTWRVYANFAGQSAGQVIASGADSPDQIFTRSIHAPTNLGTIMPNGTAKAPVLLSWDWKAGAKNYNIQVSRDPSFSSTIDSGSTDTTSWAPTMQFVTDYTNGGQLYWRVQAADSHGTAGTWSPATSLVFATKLVGTLSTTSMAHGTTATVTVTVKDGVGHVVSGATVHASGAGITAVTKKTGLTGKASFKVHPTKTGKITFSVSKTACLGTKVYVTVF